HQSYPQFRRTLTRAVASIAPHTQEQARAAGMAQRRVVLDHQPNGMSTLWALLPTEGARTLTAAINAITSQTNTNSTADERTINQRHADALVEIGAWIL